MSRVTLMFLVLTMSACSGTSTGSTTAAQSVDSTLTLVPHTEYMNLRARSASENCGVFLGAWDPARPGCYVSLTHCSVGGGPETCTGVVDEHRLACGASDTLCGVAAKCECPATVPSIVHPPGTITLSPGQSGARFGASGCDATPREDTAAREFGICSVAIHECPSGANAECIDRRQDISAGGRVEVCGALVRCVGTATR